MVAQSGSAFDHTMLYLSSHDVVVIVEYDPSHSPPRDQEPTQDECLQNVTGKALLC